MKKLFTFLILAILLVSCSGDLMDSEEENPGDLLTEKTLFKISLHDNYYSENKLALGLPKAILTDANGDLITEGELNNGTSTELKAIFDIETENYDLTFFTKQLSNDRSSVVIETFIDVSPNDYIITEKEYVDPNPNDLKHSVYIRHEGNFVEEHDNQSNSFSVGEDHYHFSRRLHQVPDDYYVSFKNWNEDFSRYYFKEDVTGEIADTIGFNETQTIEKGTTINYPENDYLDVTYQGIRSNHPSRYSTLKYLQEREGSKVGSFQIPKNLFDEYRIYTTLKKGNESFYTIEQTSEIDTIFKTPEFEVDVISEDFDQIQITSCGDYDFYTLQFYHLSVASNRYNVNWKIYGSNKNEIEYKLPNIIEEIKAFLPDFDPSNLVLTSVRLERFSGLEKYTDYIITRIDSDSELKSLITKQEVYTVN